MILDNSKSDSAANARPSEETYLKRPLNINYELHLGFVIIIVSYCHCRLWFRQQCAKNKKDKKKTSE